MSLNELYHECESDFPSIEDFIIVVDILYLLKSIEVDLSTGVVRRVD